MEETNVQENNISTATAAADVQNDTVNNVNFAQTQQPAPVETAKKNNYLLFENNEECRKYFENNFDYDDRKRIIDNYLAAGLTKAQIEKVLEPQLNAEAREKIKSLQEAKRLAGDTKYQQRLRVAKSAVETYKGEHIKHCQQQGIPCDENYLNELDTLLTTPNGVNFIENMKSTTMMNNNQEVDAHANGVPDANRPNFNYEMHVGENGKREITIDNVSSESVSPEERNGFLCKYLFTSNGINQAAMKKFEERFDINLG